MNTIGIQLRISDLLFAVQKRWKIIVSLTLMGLVFGLLLSGMTYVQSAVQTFQIEGSFAINAVDTQGRYTSNGISPNRTDMTMATEMYDTVYYTLRSDRLLYKIINEQQMLGVSASDIRGGLSISQYGNTNIITMRLTWDQGEEGLMLWQSIVDAANELLPQILQVGRLQIFNEPQVKSISSRTSNIKTWMLLPVLGLGAGMGFAVAELLMKPTLINMKDVEGVFGLETIGIIPYDAEFFSHKKSLLVADEKSSSEVTQNFAAAAYILRNRIGFKEDCHCFYVTSTTGQEGRTTVAANLAIQLSDMERKTLLIDFDYKNPMLGSLFLNNVDYNRSLNALYRGEITVADAITTMTGYLDLLPMVMEHSLIYLDSTIIEMISQLRSKYQYIIIDAPPVGKASETLSLNQVANTVLFVMRYDTASIPEIQATLEKLDKSGIRILGCIVNGLKSTKNMLFGGNKEENGKKTKQAAQKKKKKKKPASKSKKEEIKEQDDALHDLTSQDKAKKQKAGKKPAKAKGKEKAPAKPGFFDDLPADGSEAQEKPKAGFFDDLPVSGGETPPAAGPEAPAVIPPAPPESKPEFFGETPAFTPPAPQETRAEQYGEPPAVIPPVAQEIIPEQYGEPPAVIPPAVQEIIPKQFEEPPAPAALETVNETREEAPAAPFGNEAVQAPIQPPEVLLDKTGFPDGGEKPEQPESGAFLPVPVEGTVYIEEPEIVQPASDTVQEAIPAAPEVPAPAAPKKRGLFGGRPKSGEAPKKPAKPAAKPKKEAPPKKKAAAEEPAPAKEKKAKPEPEKKKEKGFPFWGKPKKKEEIPLEPPKTEPAVLPKSRNVFEDLMDDTSSEPAAQNDADVMEELLRMGLDGSWSEPSEPKKAEVKQETPRNKKRSPFDDL